MKTSRTNLSLMVCSVLALASAAEAQSLFAVGANPNVLYSVDVTTGDLAAVGGYSLTEPGSELFLGGLEFGPNGTLFGVSVGPRARLYSIDPVNAAANAIGLMNEFSFEGAVAFDPNTGAMFGANGRNANVPTLYTIDPLTGQATPLGIISGGPHDFNGFGFDTNGDLFGLDRVTNSLWKIDKTNPWGAGTMQVGSSFGPGLQIGSFGGMTVDPVSGQAFGYAGGSRTLFAVSLLTGVTTVIRQYAAGSPNLMGLAFIPEPCALSLMMLAGVVLAVRRRRR
ncbi:MAG: PEP-CTERM sorting domain-containing protein [Phycisphaerae bacterium]